MASYVAYLKHIAYATPKKQKRTDYTRGIGSNKLAAEKG